jgi:Ca-activated chloride channel family protein
MGRYTSVIAVWIAALLLTGAAAQPGAGNIQGFVRDSAGTALTGAEVHLTSRAQPERSTFTDAKGEFAFRGVPPGSYTVTATLAGFARATTSVSVTPGTTAKVSFMLQPASMAEQTNAPKAETYVNAMPASSPAAMARGYGGGLSGFLGGPEFNTEAYDKIDDNQWTAVSTKPLSTFSIDVDTASYSNIRRFLNEAKLPPKDAVRIEELINYFSYAYPEPRDRTPFAVTTSIGECPWNPKHRLALVGLQAKRLEANGVPPRNLVFLIDVSGSMATPQKLPLVKASLAMLARNLTEKDRLAIVVYAGAAGLVLPSTSGSDTMTILEALGRLGAGGSTNGAQGLQLAYQTAREHFIKGGVNRVVLATDGDFNVGVTSQGDLIRLIEQNRDSGIALSVLGFGMGNLKDSTMEKLADKGNGNYSYIDTLTEAEKVLVQEAGGTLVTVAKDVKLQVEFNPRTVAAYRLIGYENRMLQDQDFNNDRKDAGDMGAGHSVTALYEIVPAGEPIDIPGIDPLKYQRPGARAADASSDEAMTVKIRYKQPGGDSSALVSVPVAIKASPNAALGFASAVAEFGLVLRDSEFKGSASYAEALTLAKKFKGEDQHGHRAEFIRLIGVADSISRLQAAVR